jgi:hypothetical protein
LISITYLVGILVIGILLLVFSSLELRGTKPAS